MRFADPKSDIAFKKIFGNENRREILISFINAILSLPEGRRILDVEILNPYQVPRIEGLKETTLDVRARDQRNIQYIVEMQVQKRTGFEKRVLYYSAKAYSNQIQMADNYPALNQVIFIGICDFEIFKGKDYLTRHLILNQATLQQEIRDLEFNFIEIPKFRRKKEELKGIIEEWVYFLKHAPNLEIIPTGISDEGLKGAYEVAGMHLWSRKELELYDYWSMRLQDERGALEYATEKGLKQGIEQGIQKEKEEIARTLNAKGYGLQEISSVTGLLPEELKRLLG